MNGLGFHVHGVMNLIKFCSGRSQVWQTKVMEFNQNILKFATEKGVGF